MSESSRLFSLMLAVPARRVNGPLQRLRLPVVHLGTALRRTVLGKTHVSAILPTRSLANIDTTANADDWHICW